MENKSEITGGPDHPYTQYRQEYDAKFRTLSDAELTMEFNKSSGIPAWNFTRAALIDALFGEFERRKLDCSVIGNDKARSLRYCVFLVGKKFYRLTSLNYDFAYRLLEHYVACKSRNKHSARVKLVAFDDIQILYTIAGNAEVCKISVKEVVLKDI